MEPSRNRRRTAIPHRDRGLAWFVSPHGLGHAARACAVIEACARRRPDLRHEVFTTIPETFFRDSLPGVVVRVHRLECDVGMVQRSPFAEDVEATVRALGRLPLDPGPGRAAVVEAVAAAGCGAVVCDIAPLGLVVADRLGVPGVLVENFSWDWIYRAYDDPRLGEIGARFARIFASATLHIQTEPVCRPSPGARTVPPIARRPRRDRAAIRSDLDLPDRHRMVLVSVSGLDPEALGGRRWRPPPATTVVAPGRVDRVVRRDGLVVVPAVGGPHHPDLIGAADAVLGKLGYSTVAEAVRAGTPFGYLRRARFPESPVLEDFVCRRLTAEPLPEEWLDDPATTEVVERLVESPKTARTHPDGAALAAELILDRL